ncbi:hypothetical protein QA640_18175 [Bradyrhizobium sp. CB82]|uniref:hypothetical protein n=1 Tax=Bradyrhizobium sp. CB82 TaxID=3039159 RepID=UPI0024B13989|nr:hypothetical protein [Bradyrhizobium sp. CB82]WFU44201.1 hypothetical protein QA640_18175 [Bradyrhizobium sp. CB82]
MYELEDQWIEAFQALPNTKPLVDMLRNRSMPMPFGARDQLAEMISPGKPALEPFVFELKPNKDYDIGKMLEKLEVAYLYGAARADGEKSQQAADEVGHEYARLDGRTVYRWLQVVKEFGRRLRGN